jgi:hypothetical protein
MKKGGLDNMPFDSKTFYINRIRVMVKRLPKCKWPWIWKSPNNQSGRCYRTIRLAREAAERFLRHGDDPLKPSEL